MRITLVRLIVLLNVLGAGAVLFAVDGLEGSGWLCVGCASHRSCRPGLLFDEELIDDAHVPALLGPRAVTHHHVWRLVRTGSCGLFHRSCGLGFYYRFDRTAQRTIRHLPPEVARPLLAEMEDADRDLSRDDAARWERLSSLFAQVDGLDM